MIAVHVKSLAAFRGRINGRLIRLEPGDIVPPELRQRALAGGWGEADNAESAGKEKKAPAKPRPSDGADSE
jgi:hypothetical protein